MLDDARIIRLVGEKVRESKKGKQKWVWFTTLQESRLFFCCFGFVTESLVFRLWLWNIYIFNLFLYLNRSYLQWWPGFVLKHVFCGRGYQNPQRVHRHGENMKTPHRGTLCPVWGSHPGPSSCEAGVLTTLPPCCPYTNISWPSVV